MQGENLLRSKLDSKILSPKLTENLKQVSLIVNVFKLYL